MTELLGLLYSPWTEKARWVLDVRHVPYTFRTYAPLVGEPMLRAKLGRWTGRVSVPVLTPDVGQPISDSTAIARWADEQGEGPRLFPPEHEEALTHLAALSERALEAGRALSLLRVLEDREALLEMVPRALQKPLGPLAVPIAGFGIRRTLRKYGATRIAREAHESALTAVLDELRAALAAAPAANEPRTLLERFTFADIAMAQALGFVSPPEHGVRIGKASRKNFTDDPIRSRYADLVAWRDALYERYRPRT